MNPTYRYRAKYRSAYDADTVRVDVDLGFGVWLQNQSLRLLGVDAPELRGEERPQGIQARNALRSLLDGADLVVETDKDKSGKYGRWLARLWVQHEGINGGDWLNVNAWLVECGFAKAYGSDAPRWIGEDYVAALDMAGR
jgi:micrococcal nuclease